MDFLKLKITPMQLRNAIEIELQTTDDAKLAAIIAIKKLKKDPGHYEGMQKAKDTSKLTKKVITNKLGKRQTVYVRLGDEKKESWVNKFANMFGFKDRKQVMNKLDKDYKENEIDKKYNLTLDGWKNHASEYFNNKDKWDKFFSGKKEKKDKPKKTEKKEVKKTEKKVKRDGLKLAVMKELFKLYGGKIEKEEEKSETSEQKKQDIKISKEINKVTPDTRNEVEREIVGIPEPPPEEDIVTPKIDFKPVDSEWTIPFYKGGDSKRITAKDYMGVIPKDIYLVSDKNILTEKKPSYVPEVDEEFLRSSKYFLPTMKLGEDKYIILTHRETIRGTSQPIQGENKYAIVTRDVFAATLDYHLKLAKAKSRKSDDEWFKKYKKQREEDGHPISQKKPKYTKIRMMPVNKMSYAQSNFMRSFTAERGEGWNKYTEIRNDLKQKTSDMEIQIEEYYNTHAKGQETAYGDTGTKNNLLKDYGVKVKRQNGSEINDVEIQEIKSAMDDVFSVFGNRKEMADKFGLKISHSGNKNMHARNAAGLFFPSMKAIGVTAKHGDKGTGFILAHEWGHFMDYYMGEKSERHYISDDPNSTAGEIAGIFRKSMTRPQSSNYQNRTCECFARAMEQYWTIKTNNKELMQEWDSGNHPSEDVFKHRLMPLIDKFFTENDKLLKAIFKLNNKFYRRVG